MTSSGASSLRDHTAALRAAVGRLSDILASFVEDRTSRAVAAYRLELRRVATVIALTLTAVFFVCAAVAFAVFAILMALWDTHRVLTAAAIAVGLALSAVFCTQLMRGTTKPDTSVH